MVTELQAAAGILLAAPVILMLLLVAKPPAVPPALMTLPSTFDVYLQLLRAAVRKGKVPKSLAGHPEIKLRVVKPAAPDAAGYAAFLRLTGWAAPPKEAPLMWPIVHSFKLSMMAMSHADFPFNVLGSVLARNRTVVRRPFAYDERLLYTVRIDPNYKQNEKGHIEILIETTGATESGDAVWRNMLTVIVINPKKRGGGGGGSRPAPTAEAASAAAGRKLLATWSLPGDTGRRFGALTGDRNPIHLYPLTARLFGWRRPIAHALFLVARLEATLAEAGHTPAYPAVYETEFKRPTGLPAKLQCVCSEGTSPLGAAVLTSDGSKEVIVGNLNAA